MKRTLTITGFLVALAALLAAADINGTWKGEFDAGGNTRQIILDLKADGGALTGTVGGLAENDKALDIKEGKVEGDNVSFSVTTEYQGQPLKLLYKGQVSGNEMHLTMGTEDGAWSTDLVAKRSS